MVHGCGALRRSAQLTRRETVIKVRNVFAKSGFTLPVKAVIYCSLRSRQSRDSSAVGAIHRSVSGAHLLAAPNLYGVNENLRLTITHISVYRVLYCPSTVPSARVMV